MERLPGKIILDTNTKISAETEVLTLLETIIEDFLSNPINYRGYKKTTVKNLLQSDKPYSLLYINSTGELMNDALKISIKESIKAYPSNKDSAIDIYKRFIAFLERKYNVNIVITFPPVPVSITFERIMFIAKYLQDPKNRITDLSDILWVSERTVEQDIAKIRGNTGDPIQVCGKKFIMPDIERSRGKISMSSTAHPIFLTSNLTQIIIMLKGLKKMSEDVAYNIYAIDTAKSIWSQLSDYAKNRIIFVTKHLLPDELEWYMNLEDNDNNSFSSEYMCSNTHGTGCVIDCLKNGKSCFIEYQSDDQSVIIYDNCKVECYDEQAFTIIYNDQKIYLLPDNILRSSYTPEELL